MKRIGLSAALLLAVISSVGCVYSPGYVNPYNGIPYGGTWQPVCGGPADPLGIGCAMMYGYPNRQVPNGYSYPNMGAWQPMGDPCCDDGAWMSGGPQTFVDGADCDGCHRNSTVPVPMPNGTIQPSPDPKGSKSQSATGGSMTMVHPPLAPPAAPAPLSVENTSHLPAVRAH